MVEAAKPVPSRMSEACGLSLALCLATVQPKDFWGSRCSSAPTASSEISPRFLRVLGLLESQNPRCWIYVANRDMSYEHADCNIHDVYMFNIYIAICIVHIIQIENHVQYLCCCVNNNVLLYEQ